MRTAASPGEANNRPRGQEERDMENPLATIQTTREAYEAYRAAGARANDAIAAYLAAPASEREVLAATVDAALEAAQPR